MDIVFCTDNNYVMPCGIAITSLLENNKDQDITIHIIGLNLIENNLIKLKSIEQKYPIKMIFYAITQDYMSKFNLPFHEKGSKHITIAAYIRLFLAQILPTNLNKVIYLDSDVMVVDSIIDLWNIDITQYSIGGVIEDITFDKDLFERLKYPRTYSYINSGVLLINLKYWRDNSVQSQFLNYLDNNLENIILHDQDVINGVLFESTLLCPYKYNMHATFYSRKFCERNNLDLKMLRQARLFPSIIHYTYKKPWHKDAITVKKNNYIYYKNLTVWKDEPLQWSSTKTKYKVRYYKRLILDKFNIKIQRDKVFE